MCGIIGVVNLTSRAPVDPTRLAEANATLRHRGPDDEGMYVQPEIGMAMRRLSIIDVAHGHQPIPNEDATVHVGALLLGGVDSTAIAAFMRNASKQPFKTVTLGFADESFDEMKWAEASARELGNDHHSIVFSGDSMDECRTALSFLEEPTRAVQTGLYCIFRACRELGLKVVLTGEGADELLGGYSWHQGSEPTAHV
jgi:asparagine synthetase B (glutamine-hydrolysing)